MDNKVALLTSYPIYIVTKEFQIRKHHQKRINKKWRKRYGVYEWNPMPDGQVFFNEIDRVIYMTKKTYNELTKGISDIGKIGRR